MAIMQAYKAKLLWGLFILLTILAQLADSNSEYKKFQDLFLHRKTRQVNNCHRKYQEFIDHTACLPASTRYVKGGMNEVDKARIIDLHNEYRSKVSPTARNMLTLTWDDEVEMIARKWAENCEFKHDSLRFIPGRFSLGQNLALNHRSWDALITAWYIEYKDYIYGLDKQPTTKQIGHYTQLAWAKSGKIGCSYAECKDTNTQRPNFFLYVCNYAPAGRIRRHRWTDRSESFRWQHHCPLIGYSTETIALGHVGHICRHLISVRQIWGGNVGSLANPYEQGPTAANCPGRTNSKYPTLCDCRGKVCENDNSMDLSTCTCNCAFKFYVNDICQLYCDGGSDPRYCLSSYKEPACLKYVNVIYECPKMCKMCPYGDLKFRVTPTTSFSDGNPKFSVTPTTSSSWRPRHHKIFISCTILALLHLYTSSA